MVNEVRLAVPRHAASPRRVARPAEVWRLCQDAVVQASAQQGWPPERYQETGNSFVLARMVVHHHQELAVGVPLWAYTWVRAFRRQTLCDREVVLQDAAGAPLVVAVQRWAHVRTDEMRLTRAPDSLVAAFPLHCPPETLPSTLAVLPALTGPIWSMSFRCWHTWLDPLRHVNHPTYLEWCDENLMQRLTAAGVPPEHLQPVAEEVLYRHSVAGDDPVLVQSTLVGGSADGQIAAIQHTIAHPDTGAVFALATTLRRLASGQPLVPLLQ